MDSSAKIIILYRFKQIAILKFSTEGPNSFSLTWFKKNATLYDINLLR